MSIPLLAPFVYKTLRQPQMARRGQSPTLLSVSVRGNGVLKKFRRIRTSLIAPRRVKRKTPGISDARVPTIPLRGTGGPPVILIGRHGRAARATWEFANA